MHDFEEVDDKGGNAYDGAEHEDQPGREPGIGAATIGGTGTLFDLGGDDHFDFYAPSPLDPNAPNLAPGAGGVVDDQGRCDRDSRLTLGVGNLGGTGHLNNAGGDDFYRSSAARVRINRWLRELHRLRRRRPLCRPPGRGNGATLLPSAGNQWLFQDDG